MAPGSCGRMRPLCLNNFTDCKEVKLSWSGTRWESRPADGEVAGRGDSLPGEGCIYRGEQGDTCSLEAWETQRCQGSTRNFRPYTIVIK